MPGFPSAFGVSPYLFPTYAAYASVSDIKMLILTAQLDVSYYNFKNPVFCPIFKDISTLSGSCERNYVSELSIKITFYEIPIFLLLDLSCHMD